MALVVVKSPEEWKEQFGGSPRASVVTIGNFDGVHLAHQRILRGVAERAKKENALPAVFTFDPHPARILRPEMAPKQIETLAQRLTAFESMGIAAVLVMRFDEHLAKVRAEEFARHFLAETMRASSVLVGANFRFGYRQEGDVAALREFGKKYGFDVEVVPPVRFGDEIVSSTAIRQAIAEGRVEIARGMLGRPFTLAGEIHPGTGVGRKLVVPTLNLSTGQELLPKNGVYATEAEVGGKWYRAATNIGVRPTFDGTRLAIESHLFDFSETVTAGPMQIRFFRRLRDERKFPGPEELKRQIEKDLMEARSFFESQPAQN